MNNHPVGMLTALVIAVCLGCPGNALAASPLSDLSVFRLVPGGWRVIDTDADPSGSQMLVFEVAAENVSDVHKYDLEFPLDIRLTDEFGNAYLTRPASGGSVGPAISGGLFSFYPGQKTTLIFQAQVPVPAARQLMLEISGQDKKRYARAVVPLETVQGWNPPLAEFPELSDQDLIVTAPDRGNVFAPGDRIVLEVGFSSRAGRPRRVHIVSRDYMLTDDDAAGRYELRIPREWENGDFEVLVMASWGSGQQEHIVTRYLRFEIKGS